MASKTNSSRLSEAWHNSPLFVAVVVVVLTLFTTQIGGCWQSCVDARQRDVALKLAFSGEVNAIRRVVEYTTRNANKAFREGMVLKHHQIAYPSKVFEGNVGSLGQIRDRNLIKHISTLYSFLERTNEIARRIDEGIYDSNSFPNFLRNLASCWRTAILLDMRLQEQTKNHTEMNWEVKLEKKDADDMSLANQTIQELDKLEAAKPAVEGSGDGQ